MSSEEFSRADTEKRVNLARLATVFEGFDRITVVCAIRPQWRFLQAIYLEVSRHRCPPRPPSLVKDAIESGRCLGLHFDYFELYERLRRAFGSQNIRFLDFETLKTTPNALPHSLLNITGLGQDICKTFEGAEFSNISPKPLAQWSANLLTEPDAAPGNLEYLTRASIERLYKDRNTCLLTRPEVSELKTAFASSNDKLERLQSRVQPEFKLTDPQISKSTVFREDIDVDFWLSCSRSLLHPKLKEIAM